MTIRHIEQFWFVLFCLQCTTILRLRLPNGKAMTPIDSLFSHRRRRRYPSNNQSQPSTHTNRWKEDLRRACLERARQSRLDLVRRKRGQLPTQSDNEEELSPLMMVMEECQNQKVGVNTSTTSNTLSLIHI